jgi:hypothetical protein
LEEPASRWAIKSSLAVFLHGALVLASGASYLSKTSSVYMVKYKPRGVYVMIVYSRGQPKPTYFVAVGIPILDMTETPPEAQKCWKTFI